MAGSPRIITRPTTRSPAACRRARGPQRQTFGGAEEAPSLTAAARDGDGNMRSGRKNARGAGRTKEWNYKGRQKWRDTLDKESPIQAPSLTAAARDGDGNMRSGRKNARGAGRTKEWNYKRRQKWRDTLDKESPIQAPSLTAAA